MSEEPKDGEEFDLFAFQLKMMREREKLLKECRVEESGRQLANLTAEAKAARKRGLESRKRARAQVEQTGPVRRSPRVAGVKIDDGGLPGDFKEPTAASLYRPEARYTPPDHDTSVVIDDVLDPNQTKPIALTVLDEARRGIASLMGLSMPPPLLDRSLLTRGTPAAAAGGESASSKPTPTRSRAKPTEDSTGVTGGGTETTEKPSHPFSGLDRYTPGNLTRAGELVDPQAGEWVIVEGDAEGGGKKGGKKTTSASSSSSSKWTRPRARSASRLDGLSIKSPTHEKKVVPDRLYCVGFLPCTDRVIAYAGSKEGRLALWAPKDVFDAPDDTADGDGGEKKKRRKVNDDDDEDVKGETEEGTSEPTSEEAEAEEVEDTKDDEEDDGTGSVAKFWPHSSPISDVVIPRGAPHLILTSSYDGHIRALDINRAVSWAIFEPTLTARDGLSSMTVVGTYPGAGDNAVMGADFSLYAGSYDGNAFHVDTRVGKGHKAAHWEAHDRKVSSVSSHSNYLMTSSSDATVKIWDVRKLPSHGKGTGKGHPKPVTQVSAAQAITSATFSPLGTTIAACCNENVLRVWDTEEVMKGDDAAPRHVIKHNNHTGRWLTTFRLFYDPANDDTFMVGGMGHTIDTYSASSGDLLFANSSHTILTAAPTRNNIHPCPDIDLLVSGTASGRLFIWS